MPYWMGWKLGICIRPNTNELHIKSQYFVFSPLNTTPFLSKKILTKINTKILANTLSINNKKSSRYQIGPLKYKNSIDKEIATYIREAARNNLKHNSSMMGAPKVIINIPYANP